MDVYKDGYEVDANIDILSLYRDINCECHLTIFKRNRFIDIKSIE